jgi:hypothetical protein
MNLIVTDIEEYNDQAIAIIPTFYHLENVVKCQCVGCWAEIVRGFDESFIYDCHHQLLKSLYDGLLCHDCIDLANLSPARIVQYHSNNSYPAATDAAFKKIIIDDLLKVERIHAYLAKVAECQLWDAMQQGAV